MRQKERAVPLDRTFGRVMQYKTLFQLAIFSGARQGEIIGLKWSDIDWENSQIHIQRTFNNDAWYETKTDTSDRKIDLGPAMMTALKKWKLACPTSELNLVFPNKAENPINHNNLVNRHFNPALKAAGINVADSPAALGGTMLKAMGS